MSKEKDIRNIQAYYPPEDVQFLENESRTFDSSRNFIRQLDSEKLGKLIQYQIENDEGEFITKPLGYILPVDKAQKSHLVILASGDSFATRCRNTSVEDIDLYKAAFYADPVPLDFSEFDSPLAVYTDMKTKPEDYGVKITHSSDNPTQLKGLSDIFNRAMKQVVETRENRAEGRLLTDNLIKSVTVFESDKKENPGPHKK